jgi:hypothetical protein
MDERWAALRFALAMVEGKEEGVMRAPQEMIDVAKELADKIRQLQSSESM